MADFWRGGVCFVQGRRDTKAGDLRRNRMQSTTPLPIHREQERITIIKRGELKGAKQVVRKDAGR
jgi:hypothetical protein